MAGDARLGLYHSDAESNKVGGAEAKWPAMPVWGWNSVSSKQA